MTVTSIRLASCAGALSIAVAAHADFRAALADYNAGRYLAAHEQFQRLAELGDCSSQFNLGAMALKGQGGPKDSGSGESFGDRKSTRLNSSHSQISYAVFCLKKKKKKK